jgi:potassium efflux system protein
MAHACMVRRTGQRMLLTVLLLAGLACAVRVSSAQVPAKAKAGARETATTAQTAPPVEAEALPVPATSGAMVSTLAIPLAQVADSAEALDHLLDDISRQLKAEPNLAELDRTMQARREQVRERALQVEGLLAGTPNSLQIRDEDAYWRPLSQQFAAQRKLLTIRAEGLQSAIAKLNEEYAKWQATWDQIQDPTGLEAVAARARQELDAISQTRTRAEEQLKLVLTLQNQTSQTSRQIAESMTKLGDAEEKFQARMFERDSHPLWSSRDLRSLDPEITRTLRRSADRDFETAGEYLRENFGGLFVAFVLYLVSLVGTFQLKSRARGETGTGAAHSVEVFQRPFSLALMVTVLGISEPISSAPASVASVVFLLWMIATLRLLPLLIEPGLQRLLYVLAACNLFEGFRIWMPFSPLLKRALLTWGVLGALVALGWLTRPFRLRQLHLPPRRLMYLAIATRLGLLMLAASLVANLFGFVGLAYVLGVGTLLSAFFLVALYCMVCVLHLILTAALQGDWAATLRVGRQEAIERWSIRVLVLVAVLLWLRFELYLFTIHDNVMDALSSILAYSINFADGNVSSL